MKGWATEPVWEATKSNRKHLHAFGGDLKGRCSKRIRPVSSQLRTARAFGALMLGHTFCEKCRDIVSRELAN